MDAPKDLSELRKLYETGQITASELARRIGQSKSTVHNALSSDNDPRYSFVNEMLEGAAVILAERAAAAEACSDEVQRPTAPVSGPGKSAEPPESHDSPGVSGDRSTRSDVGPCECRPLTGEAV